MGLISRRVCCVCIVIELLKNKNKKKKKKKKQHRAPRLFGGAFVDNILYKKKDKTKPCKHSALRLSAIQHYKKEGQAKKKRSGVQFFFYARPGKNLFCVCAYIGFSSHCVYTV